MPQDGEGIVVNIHRPRLFFFQKLGHFRRQDDSIFGLRKSGGYLGRNCPGTGVCSLLGADDEEDGKIDKKKQNRTEHKNTYKTAD